MTSLEELFLLYPKYDKFDDMTTFVNGWVLEDLSNNPSLTFDMVKNNPTLPWDWNDLSKHPNITYEMIINHPEFPWDFNQMMLHNPNFQKIIDNYGWQHIEQHMQNPDENVWTTIVNNPNLDWNVIMELHRQHNFNLDKLDWNVLSSHPNITWEIIQQYPTYPWNLCKIAENPNISSEILSKIVDAMEMEPVGTRMSRTTIQGISFTHLNYLNWSNLRKISQHPNLSWNIIQHIPIRALHWDEISKHRNITWEIIQNNRHLPWNWCNISENPNITHEIIANNPKEAWNYRHNVSCNPNTDVEHVIDDATWEEWSMETIHSNRNIQAELHKLGLVQLTYGEYLKNLA